MAQPRRRPDDVAGNTVFGDLTADLALRLSISSRWNGMGSIAGVPRDPGTKFSIISTTRTINLHRADGSDVSKRAENFVPGSRGLSSVVRPKYDAWLQDHCV